MFGLFLWHFKWPDGLNRELWLSGELGGGVFGNWVFSVDDRKVKYFLSRIFIST